MHGWRGPGGSLRAEDGGATAFGVLALCLTAMLVGLSIDVANLYRNETLMRLTADAAAHAGAVALARGDDPLDAAAAMVGRNMPADRFGVVTDATGLQALHLDPAANRLARADDDAPANAVLVRLQRSAGVKNLLPTFALGLLGIDGWTVETRSVAALMPTRRCGNADGLFAKGGIDLGPGVQLDDGACLHSQTAINLAAGTKLGGDLRLSLPDPAACTGACRDAAPGNVAAMNLVMPQAASHVLRLADGFARPEVTLPEETAFFATRPLQGDTEALAEVGLPKAGLRTGQAIAVSPFLFAVMRERPAGLVYVVACGTGLPGGRRETVPGAAPRIALMGVEGQATLKDIALVTDCPIEMDALTRIEGSLVIQLPPALLPGEEALTAAAGARLGDPDGTCDARLQSTLMVPGDIVLPAGMSASNLAVVAGGDVTLAPDPEERIARHKGLSVHAGGAITAAGPHAISPCPGASGPVLPPLRVIAHAMPPTGGWLAPMARPVPEAEMPGERVGVRQMEGVRAGS